MKRITYAVMSTITALVLLFGYRTSTSSTAGSSVAAAVGTASPSSISGGSSTTGQASSSAGSPPTGSSGSTASSAASPSTTATASKVVTGSVAQTRWGPVQVQITIKSGKITNVSVVQYPNNNGRDQEINAQALPVLINETLQSQSAQIDSVSGATYTSEGYLSSLQSALDQAGL